MMKSLQTLALTRMILAVIGIAFSSCGVAWGDLEKEILGKWRYQGKQTGATIESVAEFTKDGVYSCEMEVSIFGSKSKIVFKGKWSVEDDANVVIKVTETSSSLFLPKGKVMRKESVKIENNVMTYTYSGKKEREERIAVEPTPAKEAPMPAIPGVKA